MEAEAGHTVKMQRIPEVATQTMIDEHEATGHAIFRSWCAHCRAAYGLTHRHLRQDHAGELWPTVSSDFYYMQDEPKEGEIKPQPPPFLAVRDRWTKCGYAMALPSKVSSNPTTIRGFGQFLQGLGYLRICNKSDGEYAIVALKKAAAEYAKVDAQPEESPVGDHEANGEVESFVRDIKRRQRAVRSTLGTRLGFAGLDLDLPLRMMTQHLLGLRCFARTR